MVAACMCEEWDPGEGEPQLGEIHHECVVAGNCVACGQPMTPEEGQENMSFCRACRKKDGAGDG